MSAINIIFDGPPSHESGRFVEVETDDGKGINAGEWIERDDGYWALRITELPTGRLDCVYDHTMLRERGARYCENCLKDLNT